MSSNPSISIPPATPKSQTDSSGHNLWQRAELELRKDRRKKKIFDAFIQILEVHYGLQLGDQGSLEFQVRMWTVFDCAIQKLEVAKNKWTTLTTGSKNVLLIKDLINAAATSSPPAAVACAGIGIILTVRYFK